MRKAQAAMEYLMTYGWAILVVLIALAALFYLGVFNPRTSNTCIAVSPITCTDVRVAGTTLELSLGATGTSSAYFTDVLLSQPGTYTCTTVQKDNIQGPAPEKVGCDLSTSVDSGEKFSGTATVNYSLSGSAIDHEIQVQISGTGE